MNSFLKSVRSVATDSKETMIKNSIITQLSESVKEIQLCGLEENFSGDSMEIGDAANNLCSIIEAIFLHGLKDSLVHKARRVISNDVDQRPEPNFLSPLLIISHRQIIEQISSLSNITTEIGQCRAWIRIALNDSLLSSYLSLMMKDMKSLGPFYKSFAFIRDTDLVDVARKLIESVESCNIFSLPYNSSLLNHWSLPTLLLAGIWSPPLRQCPITSGIDVAQSLENSYLKSMSDNSSTYSAMSLDPACSELGKMVALNEDEALKIILANTKQNVNKSNKQDVTPTVNNGTESPQEPLVDSTPSTSSFKSIESEEKTNTFEEPSSVGNSLNRQSGWSFDENQNAPGDNVVSPTMNRSFSIEGAKSNEHSYHALIESYNMVNGPDSAVPNLEEVWQRFSDNSENSISGEGIIPWSVNNIDDKMGFEFISASNLDKQEIAQYLLQIGKLAQEKGLDNQNFECVGCKHPLGVNLCKPRICAFTGDCYCDSCMSTEAIMIPARVLHNWDFKQYHVSKRIVMFLNEIKNHPILDLKILNPYIYKGVEEMAKLENLRIQLNYLRDYLFTCREPVIEQFKRLIWPKEYMYEHIHQYSISDLTQTSGGYLAQQLQKMVDFGRDHVDGCWLCSQKGFVCELCKNPKILYPFDVESTYRCEQCSGVYHSTCLDFTRPCPKCKRRRERQEVSLLEATLE